MPLQAKFAKFLLRLVISLVSLHQVGAGRAGVECPLVAKTWDARNFS